MIVFVAVAPTRVTPRFITAISAAGDHILAEASVYGRVLNDRCGADVQRALKHALSAG